jgi:hypothetical protein
VNGKLTQRRKLGVQPEEQLVQKNGISKIKESQVAEALFPALFYARPLPLWYNCREFWIEREVIYA